MFSLIWNLLVGLIKWITSIIKCYAFVIFIFILSVLIYYVIYSYSIPNFSLIVPIFFQYDINCAQLPLISTDKLSQSKSGSLCEFTHYEVPKKAFENFFKNSYSYHFRLDMELPDSDINQSLGTFMIRLRLFDSSNKQIYNGARPALVPYLSHSLRMIKFTLSFVFYTIGFWKEAHLMNLNIIDEHVDVSSLDFSQVERIRLEIETYKPIEIVPPSQLLISADLHGLVYLMYFWRIPTLIMGISIIFVSLLVFSCCYSLWSRGKRVSPVSERSVEQYLAHQPDSPLPLPQSFDHFEEPVQSLTSS